MRIERGHRYHAHTGPAHVACLASKGKYVLTGGADGRVCLWNASSPPPQTLAKDSSLHAPIETYKAAVREVLAIDVAQDNSTFASAGNDRNVVLWDVVTAAPIRRLPGSLSGRTHSVVFAGRPAGSTGPFRPDGSTLAAGGFDGVVRIYDLRAQGGKPLMELPEAKDAILTLATQNHTFVSGSVDGTVRTYDVRAGTMCADDVGDPITSIVLDNQSRMLVTALHAPPRVLDSDGNLLARLDGAPHENYRCHAGMLPDGSAALGGGEDGQVYLWDSNLLSLTNNNTPPETLPPLQRPSSIAPHLPPGSSDGRTTQVLWCDVVSCPDGSAKGVSAGADGTVQVWAVG